MKNFYVNRLMLLSLPVIAGIWFVYPPKAHKESLFDENVNALAGPGGSGIAVPPCQFDPKNKCEYKDYQLVNIYVELIQGPEGDWIAAGKPKTTRDAKGLNSDPS